LRVAENSTQLLRQIEALRTTQGALHSTVLEIINHKESPIYSFPGEIIAAIIEVGQSTLPHNDYDGRSDAVFIPSIHVPHFSSLANHHDADVVIVEQHSSDDDLPRDSEIVFGEIWSTAVGYPCER